MASGPVLTLTLASGVRAIHSLGPFIQFPDLRARRGWVAGAFSGLGESYVNEEPRGLSRIVTPVGDGKMKAHAGSITSGFGMSLRLVRRAKNQKSFRP